VIYAPSAKIGQRATLAIDAVISALQHGIEADLEQFTVPGAGWALIEGGQILHEGGVGLMAADRPDRVTPDTLFQACSISKPIAAFAMLRLVDRGVLDLDEDVNRRLTSWRVRPTGGWQPVVTLRQLVSHSAGLTTSGFPGYRCDDELPTTTQVLDGVGPTNTFGVRVDTVPGVQFRYSGGGTLVMQQLLEDVTATPFRELVRELVLEPLGMHDSDFAQPLPEILHPRAATAHDEVGRPIEGRWHIYPELAAAGLWTTAGDLAKFALAVQSSYAATNGALLSPELARELLTPQVEATDRTGDLNQLGLGLFLGGTGQGSRFGHSGGNEGFRCHLLAYRNTGQGAAVMTNSDNGAWLVQKTLASIAAAFRWPDYPLELAERDEPDAATLAAVEGTYQLRESATVTVARDGGALLVTFTGQRPIVFTPQSADGFVAETADASLRFDHSGTMPTLIFVQNQSEIVCPRVTNR
jgi:CubicO group peptidase (beta-lactamase class C family)